MNVTLPNGQVINGVPEGTTKDQIMQKAISSGLAQIEDFPQQEQRAAQQEQQAPLMQSPALEQPKQPQEQSFVDRALSGAADVGRSVIGGIEGVVSLGTGLIAEPLAGIAGLAALANNTANEEGAFKASQTVDMVKKALTFDPRTEEGKGAIAGLGEALQTPIKKLQQFKQFIGDDAFAATDNAALAGIATALPEATIELLSAGLGRTSALRAAQKPAKDIAKTTAVNQVEAFDNATRINRLTTDVLPPQTKAGKFFQQQGELVAGGKRSAQQVERVRAVDNLFETFDVTDGARFERAIFDGIQDSVSAQKRAAGENFNVVVEQLNNAGSVQLPNTINLARRELQRQQRRGTLGDDPTINQMQDIIDSPQDLSFSDVQAFRSSVGKQLHDAKMSNPVTGSSDTRLLSQVYARLSDDMTQFATTASPATANQWREANRVYSDFATGADKTNVKSIIKRGEATPEVVDQLLFSNKKSDLDFLMDNITDQGLQAAKQRLLQKPLQKMVDSAAGEINPNVFATQIGKLKNQINAIFEPAERRGIFALRDALNQTRRAQDAAVVTATGQSVVPLFAMTNPAVLIPGVAQAIIETPILRNLLIKRRAAKTSKQRFAIDRRIQEQIDKSGLTGAAVAGASMPKDNEKPKLDFTIHGGGKK